MFTVHPHTGTNGIQYIHITVLVSDSQLITSGHVTKNGIYLTIGIEW